MDMRKFTTNTTAALQKAQATAREYGNQEIGQLHLLHALLTAEEGLIGQLMQKMQKDGGKMSAEALRLIEKLPKVSGGEQYISTALAQAIEAGESQAAKMGDGYLSVEHLFFGLTEKPDAQVKKLFASYGIEQNAFMQALASVRGDRKSVV